MLEQLRAEVLEANLELVRRGLVLYTFGNASAVSRSEGLIAIKPSGVPYDTMTPADIVVTDLEGKIVEGSLRPSSDLPTHAALYRALPQIGGVVTPTPATPPHGRKPRTRSPATEPLTPIISPGLSPSPRPSRAKRSKPTTN